MFLVLFVAQKRGKNLSHQKNVWQNDKCYPETYSETYAQLVMIQCIAWTVGVAFPQQTLKFHREVQLSNDLMIFKFRDCDIFLLQKTRENTPF